MTNPSINAPHDAQTQNPSNEYLTIDFSHRLPSCAKKNSALGLVDTIEHFAYRAISILEAVQKAHEDSYFAIGAAISEIEDIRAVAVAHYTHIKARAETPKPYLDEYPNTNHQT